jgi:hypothetical protein
MTEDSTAEERAWTAEKRDFVADRRDDIATARDAVADARDVTADERERIADEREAMLEEWERLLDERAAALGMVPDRVADKRDRAVALRHEASVERQEERHDRENRRTEREHASTALADATTRRQAANPRTSLAMAFAEIAEHLYQADTFEEVLLRIANMAVSTISACDFASVAVTHRGIFRTIASSGPAASEVDASQYRAGEGPGIDAMEASLVYVEQFPDERWPELGSSPLGPGVCSSVSYRLGVSSPASDGSVGGR